MKKIQRSFTSEEVRMIQEIGKKEDIYRLPGHLRLTQWCGDYGMYGAAINLCEGELQRRDMRKFVHYSDYEREDIPAGRDLYGYTWTHYGTGIGFLRKNSSGETISKYDFSHLLNGFCDNVAAADDYVQVLSEWERSVYKFVYETEEKVALDAAPEQEFLRLKEQYEQLYREVYVYQEELASRKKSNLESAKRIVKYDKKPLANLILNMYYGQTVEDSCSFCEILGLKDKCMSGHCTDCIDDFLRAYYTGDAPVDIESWIETGMKKHYVTFGSDDVFPYSDTYLIVLAETKEEALAKYRANYPDATKNVYRFSEFYTELQWKEVKKLYPGEPAEIIE